MPLGVPQLDLGARLPLLSGAARLRALPLVRDSGTPPLSMPWAWLALCDAAELTHVELSSSVKGALGDWEPWKSTLRREDES